MVRLMIFVLLLFLVVSGLLIVFGKTQDNSLPMIKKIEMPFVEKQKNPVTILVFGDLMLDRYVSQKIKTSGGDYPFENIKNLTLGNDLVLVNLEGSFTDFPPKPLSPDNMIFTFDPKLVPGLKNNGFNLFNLANNHSLNFGQAGLEQSKKYLADAGLNYFGDPLNFSGISKTIKVGNRQLGFVGYNDLTDENFEKVLQEISSLRKAVDFLVVYVHWGNEYQTNFSQKQQKQARSIIEVGADVIFGSHPHVVQPIELYLGKPIFYSLGNFLFDQTFSEKTQRGLGVKITISKKRLEYVLIPLEIKGMQVSFVDGFRKEIILQEIANGSLATEDYKRQIREGKISF